MNATPSGDSQRWGARVALGLACGVLACASPTPPPAQEDAPEAGPEPVVALPETGRSLPAHVLLLSISGLTPGDYVAADAMPQLAAMAAAGAAADGLVPVAPATTTASHATFVTGRSPAAHGLAADHPIGPHGVAPERQREAGQPSPVALWDLTRHAGFLTAAIGWPSSADAPVDWSLPEIYPVRLGESWPELLEGVATPTLVRFVREHGAAAPQYGFPGPARDALLTDLACEVMAGEGAPRLLLLRWSQTGPQLERYGPDTEPVREAFARVDGELRRLAGCLAAAGRLAQSAFFLVGDGPYRPVHTWIQPNVALAEAGLIVPAPKARAGANVTGIRRWDALARSNGGSAFVYAEDAETALLARRALDEAATESGAFRVVSAEEMLAARTDRSAWFGLEALPGFAFGDGLVEARLLLPSPVRGTAGSLAAAEGFPHRTAFVAWGAGVRTALRIPQMDQLDVGPTVARALGLELPEADGRAQIGILHAPPVARDGR